MLIASLPLTPVFYTRSASQTSTRTLWPAWHDVQEHTSKATWIKSLVSFDKGWHNNILQIVRMLHLPYVFLSLYVFMFFWIYMIDKNFLELNNISRDWLLIGGIFTNCCHLACLLSLSYFINKIITNKNIPSTPLKNISSKHALETYEAWKIDLVCKKTNFQPTVALTYMITLLCHPFPNEPRHSSNFGIEWDSENRIENETICRLTY